MAPLHIVVDRNAQTISYGPSMYTYGGKVPFDELKNDMSQMCRERIAILQMLDDQAQLDNGTTVGQWREWFASRKDG